MSSYNKVILMGNLTRDPEVRAVNGVTVAVFGVALNETYRSKDGTRRETVTFMECEAWNQLGQLCGKWLRKGRCVMLDGKLRVDSWEKNGERRSRTKVVVENLKFCGPAPSAGAPQTPASAATPAETAVTAAPPPPSAPDPVVADPEDLPF